MKLLNHTFNILLLISTIVIAQNYKDTEFDADRLMKSSVKIPYRSMMLEGQNQLETIELVANSSGPITPQFIYKGLVDINAEPLVVDPVAFTNRINGNSMSSISPNDNGQFYVSQGGDIILWRMLSQIQNAKRPQYEIRFGADNAGLALDYFGTGAICQVPFTIWDLNGTPMNLNDDIQMLPLIFSQDSDSTWGIKTGYPASWADNPAQESDWIYMHYFNQGLTYNDFETAYQQQTSSGNIDPDLYNTFADEPVFRRITINSLDANPLSTINSLNGLPRPAPGTTIRWTVFVDININIEFLYSVVNESYSYFVNATGWPIPTLSALQLPSWLTLGNNFEIYGTPTVADQGWNTIGLQASNTNGTTEGWYDMWVDMLPWNWVDHDNGNVKMSVFNVSKLGMDYPEGVGFQFNGVNGYQNGLISGDLIVALSDSQISGSMYSDRNFHDFATTNPIVPIAGPLMGFNQAYMTEYNDSRNLSPLGIKIVQQSYSKDTAPDNDYVIVDYEIYNENSSPLNGLYVALQADWDVGENTMNLVAFDNSRNTIYVYEENGTNNPNYYAITLLFGGLSGNSYSFSNVGSVLFYMMHSILPAPTVVGEYNSMLASGPYNLAPNEGVRVVFALTGGADLADLLDNVDAAINVNLNRRPAQISPQNGSTGISINPRLAWTEIYGATEYQVQLATDFSFSNIVRDNTGIFTDFQYSGLDPEITYFWRVRAKYGVEVSDWSDAWNFTTYALPALTVQNATNMTDVSATLNGEVNPNGHNIAVGFEFGEENSYGNFVTAEPDTFNGTVNQFVYSDVSGLRTNWAHHYRVVVNQVDGEFSIHGIDQIFYTQSYPTSINISTNLSFPTYNSPTDYNTGDYRIIGLPGQKDSRLDLTKILSGEHNTAWQAYWDNGIYSNNPDDYLVEFDGSSNFRLGGGHAIWLVNKGNFNINFSGIPTMPLDGDDNARISLHNGWNLITCPFIRQVPWWAIQQVNSVSNPVYEFTGGWNIAQHLTPYQGYLFDNSDNLTELIIPYRETLLKQSSKNEYDWRIKIALHSNEFFDNSSYLGVSEQSEMGYDYLDFRKPHAVGDIPSVYFDRPQWDNYSIYATDIRPPIIEVEKWDFQVSANPGINVNLKFAEVESVPSIFDVVLLDRVNSKYVDLRKNNSYQFSPVIATTKFEIIIGYQEYIQEEISSILPMEFSLGKNFPNPFNPSTIIPVSIPKLAELTLKVYNILGKEIKTIFAGSKEAGNHYFLWDGTNEINQQVAAGVYLYRLTAKDGKVFVGKMLLVK